MNNSGRTIAKNASVMMASQLITWGLTLVLTIFLPRYLGAAGTGKFQLATSLWAIMAIFIAFGMDTLLTKEISRNPDLIPELFTTSVFLRVLLFAASFVILLVYAHLVGYPEDTRKVLYVIGLSTLIAQITSACAATLQGLERMEFISLSDIAGKAVSTIVSILLLWMGFGLIPIAFVLVGAALVSLGVQYIALNRIRPVRFRFDRQRIGWMLKSSFPYMLLFGFLIFYNQIDVIIISLMVSEKEIGWYGAANRLFGSFLFIPTVLIAALFPALARMHKSQPESLQKLMSKGFELLLIVGVPLGLGVMVIADPLVVFLYGPDFANSGPILMVMGLVLILTYQNMILGQFFISSDRQNIWTRVMAIAVIVTIPLDLLLVPWCQQVFGIGALGGALSYLVTEAGMVLVGLAMLPKGLLGWKDIGFALRVLAAGAAMAGVVGCCVIYLSPSPLGPDPGLPNHDPPVASSHA